MLRLIRHELKQGKALLQFGFLKGLGQGLGMLAPLVIAEYFAGEGVPGEELFGSYSLAKTVVFFFTMILIASTQVPFIVFANQEKAKTGKINKAFSIQSTFLILSFCIFLAITLSLSKYIVKFAQINRGDLLFILLAFFGIALKTFICNLFMAMGQRVKNALVEFTFGFFSLALIFVLYFLDWINLRTVFSVYPISAGVVIIIFVWLVDFKQLFPFELEREYFGRMFDFAKWMFLGTTAIYFINWGDNMVLRYFGDVVSTADIGVYNVGYQFFKGLVTLTTVVGFYFLPFISQNIGNPDKIRDYLWRKRPMILAPAIVCVVVLFFLLPYIFRFIFGDTYQGAVGVLRVLLAGSILYLYSTFYHAIYNAANRYKILQVFNVVQAVIKVGLSLLFIPAMGLMGAAVATVISYFAKVFILELHFQISIKRQLKL